MLRCLGIVELRPPCLCSQSNRGELREPPRQVKANASEPSRRGDLCFRALVLRHEKFLTCFQRAGYNGGWRANEKQD